MTNPVLEPDKRGNSSDGSFGVVVAAVIIGIGAISAIWKLLLIMAIIAVVIAAAYIILCK